MEEGGGEEKFGTCFQPKGQFRWFSFSYFLQCGPLFGFEHSLFARLLGTKNSRKIHAHFIPVSLYFVIYAMKFYRKNKNIIMSYQKERYNQFEVTLLYPPDEVGKQENRNES